jgi:hypothetical protein
MSDYEPVSTSVFLFHLGLLALSLVGIGAIQTYVEGSRRWIMSAGAWSVLFACIYVLTGDI